MREVPRLPPSGRGSRAQLGERFCPQKLLLASPLLYRITEVVRATEGALSRGGRGAALLLRQPQVGSTVS
eukprot:COSAG05_NODE_186_length_14726_cov_28.333630_6_plen_70_part_00